MGFTDHLALADGLIRDTLGSTVTYTPGSGSPVSVIGLFDALYVRVDLGEAGMSSFGPAISLVLSDLPAGAEDDTDATVTVNSVEYRVHTIQPDGMGMVRFLLHLV